MRSFSQLFVVVSGLLSTLTLAAPGFVHDSLVPEEVARLQERQAQNCNTATNRACWNSNFNINTDVDTAWPVTGQIRRHTLTLTEVQNWRGPDGVVRKVAQLVNGKFGGPAITADWGDTIEITVINNLDNNGTSIHWHGIHQKGTNLQDGANGATECPIPPRERKVYTFLATQHGTSWYHSHFSAQYANGVFGPIIINGPTSLNYEVDLGAFPITDYYYPTADEMVEINKFNGPPPSDNVLFNGTAKHPTTGAGEYSVTMLQPGKRHKLRIINTSAENHFIVNLANHDMTIVAVDFIPVQSQTVQSIFVAIGQRFDVTIDASKAVDSYWFNATFVQTPNADGTVGFPCGTSVNPFPAAIFRYEGAPARNPTRPGSVARMTTCDDILNLTPVVRKNVNINFTPNPGNTLDVGLDLTQPNQLFTWTINNSAINVNWNRPIVDYVMTNTESQIPRSDNIVRVEAKDQWTFWLVQNDPTFPIPHPFHLHGHDFLVLGRGDGVFNPATARLNGNNPARRDVTMLPSLGWIVIAFKTDNPGAWLMHCHIAWHVSLGLSVDFLERTSDLRAQFAGQPGPVAIYNQNCAKWRAYYPALAPYDKHDSGI